MAGVTPFNNAFGAGVYPKKYGPFSDGAGCNLYYFDPASDDRLDFGTAFTGNFKANIATLNGVVGLNANLAGLTLANSPEDSRDDASLLVWNQVDINVSAMDGICDNTFEGVVANYAKDDAWYDVNMGPLISPPPPCRNWRLRMV